MSTCGIREEKGRPALEKIEYRDERKYALFEGDLKVFERSMSLFVDVSYLVISDYVDERA